MGGQRSPELVESGKHALRIFGRRADVQIDVTAGTWGAVKSRGIGAHDDEFNPGVSEQDDYVAEIVVQAFKRHSSLGGGSPGLNRRPGALRRSYVGSGRPATLQAASASSAIMAMR
jgi:hypothetical protein